jgi:ATP-dependent Clp protease ATP-binding subunit ClpC
MFERFTDAARKAVVLAQDEAHRLRHNYIGTEHLLLGLLREEKGIAARVFESLGVTVDPVRAQVVRIVGEGTEVTAGQIPFTPRAKKVLELALREAVSLGDNYIGTEHILLGLMREGDGVAARILLDTGIDDSRIRHEAEAHLSRKLERSPEPRSMLPALRRGRDPSVTPTSPWEAVAAPLWVAFALAIGVLLGWLLWGA